MATYCTNCGTAFDSSSARCCAACGTPRSAAPAAHQPAHSAAPGIAPMPHTPAVSGPAGADLTSKWKALDAPVRALVIGGGAIVGLVVVLKILPALVAAMGIGAFLALLFVPYWLPTIIAFKRKHPDKVSILLVNFFFGWTFLGWVLSLVWAASSGGNRNGAQAVVVNTYVTNSAVNAAPAPISAPRYEVGDVVNGHRFNGMSWEPVAV